MSKGKRQADNWRIKRKIVRGSTRRIEFHLSNFLCHTMALTAHDMGVLQRMLMAEAVGEPGPDATNEWVQRAYDCRDEYRVIKGSFARVGVSLAKRKAVFERDGGVCGYCNQAIEWADYHCDHVEPVAKGGGDEMDNLRAACRPCNLSKKDKTVGEWRQ